MSEVEGTISLFTVDRIAFSLRPADRVRGWSTSTAGGRHPVELTDVDVDALKIGDRVEMTFRKLFTADDIHNYFWKSANPFAAEEHHMGSHGIKDQVAIVGMGCTPFGEHWNKGTDDLLIDAAEETFASAGIDKGRGRRVTGSAPRCRAMSGHGARPARSSCTTSR